MKSETQILDRLERVREHKDNLSGNLFVEMGNDEVIARVEGWEEALEWVTEDEPEHDNEWLNERRE